MSAYQPISARPFFFRQLTQCYILFHLSLSDPRRNTTLAYIPLGILPHAKKLIFRRLADRSHITPPHVAPRLTSTTTQQRPATTHITFLYRRLVEHLFNLSVSFHWLQLSQHLATVLEITVFRRSLTMFFPETCRIQRTAPPPRQVFPQLWCPAILFLNHSAPRNV